MSSLLREDEHPASPKVIRMTAQAAERLSLDIGLRIGKGIFGSLQAQT